jgi:hypothetical protein
VTFGSAGDRNKGDFVTTHIDDLVGSAKKEEKAVFEASEIACGHECGGRRGGPYVPDHLGVGPEEDLTCRR